MQRLPKRLVESSLLTTGAIVYYTAPANTVTTISACVLTNTTASAVTVTLSLVPTAESGSAANSIVWNRVISAGESYIVGPAIGQSLTAGGKLQAFAGTGAAVSLIASGYETS